MYSYYKQETEVRFFFCQNAMAKAKMSLNDSMVIANTTPACYKKKTHIEKIREIEAENKNLPAWQLQISD